MRLKSILKTIVVAVVLVVSVVVTGLAMTGCGEEKPDKEKEIKQALSTVNKFLENAKEDRNYTDISEYSDGSIYKYSAYYDKIKIEYNGTTTYGVTENGCFYKITQTDELQWHKSNDVSDLPDPQERIAKLISRINATPWNDFNNKTKTLICVLDDGNVTANIDSDKLIVNLIMDTGSTTTFTIKDIGKTVVALPDNIIDDTQE